MAKKRQYYTPTVETLTLLGLSTMQFMPFSDKDKPHSTPERRETQVF